MSVRNYPIGPEFDLQAVLHHTAQNLSAQGYQCQVSVMNPQSGIITVAKDREGLTNIIGLGLECRASFTVINGSQLTINVDSEWTNKIIALAVGWFLCFVPFVTGVVGTVNQLSLPEKIFSAINIALSSMQGGAQYGSQNYGYQQQNGFNQPNDFNQQ